MSEIQTLEITSIQQYLKWRDDAQKSFIEAGHINMPPDFKYATIEGLVLAHGRPFEYAPKPRKYRKGKIKECFSNAFNLANNYPDELTYVEGFACGIIAVNHAWCVDKNLRVVDNTWKPDQSKEYFGIPFEIEFVCETILRKKTYGVLEDWESDFPLLRGKIDINDPGVIKKL